MQYSLLACRDGVPLPIVYECHWWLYNIVLRSITDAGAMAMGETLQLDIWLHLIQVQEYTLM